MAAPGTKAVDARATSSSSGYDAFVSYSHAAGGRPETGWAASPLAAGHARPHWSASARARSAFGGGLTAYQPVSQSPGGFGWSIVRNVTGTEAGHSGG